MPTPRDPDVESLLAYLEGRATPDEVDALERRLKQDPDLAESLAVQAKMSVMLHSLGRERSRIEEAEQASLLPPSQEVRSKFVAIRTRRHRADRNDAAAWRLGLAAAAAFIAIAILALLWSSEPVPAARSRSGPSPAERRLAEAQRKRAEERLRDLERERTRLLETPVTPGKKPESITEESRKAALAEIDARKLRIEEELQSAIARGTAAAPGEEKPADPLFRPVPPLPKEQKPGNATQASVAKVLRVSGEVFAVAPGARTSLVAGQDLLSGQSVETGNGASAVEFAYPDRTRVELGADTIVRDLRSEGGKRISIDKGTLRAEVKPQPRGQPMVVDSAQGEAVVLGTVLKVVVAPDGTTLEVEEGKVRFRNKNSGKAVDVASGHFAVASAGVEFSPLALPATLYAATFDDGRAPGWTFSPRYPWTLKAALTSPVYAFNDPKAQRGDLTAVLASKLWQDGVFELDARPEEWDAANLSSFLVFVRFRDQDNTLWFEYMLNRGTWSIALLQMNGGALTTIASDPAPALETGRPVRLRVEAKDDDVRALLEGKEVLRGKTTVLAPGRLALCPMASRVSFDNIRVSTLPVRPKLEKGK